MVAYLDLTTHCSRRLDALFPSSTEEGLDPAWYSRQLSAGFGMRCCSEACYWLWRRVLRYAARLRRSLVCQNHIAARPWRQAGRL